MSAAESASDRPVARLFRGGTLFDGRTFVSHRDLRTDDEGRIAEIGTGLRPAGERVVDLDGRWLLPGLVDCHVHFREPGLERKEGYPTGTAGALHGGVTSVLEIQNNPPLLTSRALLDEKLAGRAGRAHADYGCYANLVEESLPELAAMAPRTPAFKCFLGCSTGAAGVEDEDTLRRWFRAAAAAGVKVVAHCEDNKAMERAAAELRGADLERHDLRRPVAAEVASIRDALRVAAEVGLALHVFHLSTVEGAQLVAAAAAEGRPVTGTTGPHYLLVTAEEAAAAAQNRFKVNPSIKYAADRDGLRELLAAGKLAGVGTDHAPHPLAEKDRPYAKAPSGFPSVDLLLPLLVAVHDRFGLSLERALASVTRDPAEEFGLAAKGRLAVGADADLVVADPGARRKVEEALLPSRSKWSPYHGWELRAFADQVFLRGHRVFADGAVDERPRGRSLF